LHSVHTNDEDEVPIKQLSKEESIGGPVQDVPCWSALAQD